MRIIFLIFTGILALFWVSGCVANQDPLSRHIKNPPASIDGYNIYVGDLHNHTSVSGGYGTPDDAYETAKNIAHLDFFAITEHSWAVADNEWRSVRAAADRYNEDGAFAALWGFEWSSSDSGHVNVLNTQDYCDATGTTATFSGLCEWLGSRDAITFFNHPGWKTDAYAEFDHFSGAPQSAFIGMELWNDVDGFDRYYYTNGYYPDDNGRGYFDEALLRGWKIGAAGFDDNHSANWGMKSFHSFMILASRLDRQTIIDALKSRRFYSSSTDSIGMSFIINGNEMGATINAGKYPVHICAIDSRDGIFSRVIMFNRNHDVEKEWLVNTPVVSIDDTLSTMTDDYFYIKITETDGNEAISSPIWIVN